LDEFGELPEAAQVRLLRVLQSGEFNRVGETRSQKVDVRVIAATNRDLGQEVVDGCFRMDLYYRVAIGVLTLPPLKEREGDVLLLADHLMADINQQAAQQPNYKDKKISVKAKNIILAYPWPGNVRELYGALLRASIWSNSTELTEQDVQEALLKPPKVTGSSKLPDVSQGIDIQSIIEDIKQDYIEQAMVKTGGNKKKAAAMLGLPNYQTLTNWMEKLGLS
jgi:transcriptional regulator with GAF, ATPase, and Fis domain